MSKQTKETLDFNKLEDLFFCIDVLTKARFSLQSNETELAEDIDRIIYSLTTISQKPTPQICDKVVKETQNDDNGIVDLLTGEKIR